ncbi:TRAP transporter 4TM/12TM fusion protein [Chromohalobacter marismortui]|uniref:TRAP transporter 4TM/12TM fusion protein n=1 Tax=Chromohalobacter marismortui TaxID=42055 RepID=A0A4R7NMI6_9GAMM|nr:MULTISPECIES: TRAP transporter permease [Chromohalobacter]MCI0509619.1 TRAP transporter permease [Chromohalobacter sp.]MCI0593706.1 TRAP transporter permease [Chromohalobacter sp.]TDU21838.1 TRAP transporter 4TM/12TM fusion protein [Chromohalobacter marismortui]
MSDEKYAQTAEGDDQAVKEALEKFDRESLVRDALPGFVLKFVTVVAVVLAIFHLYTSFSGPLVDVAQRSIHLYTLLGLTFILYPLTRKGARDRVPWGDAMLAVLAFGVGIYMLVVSDRVITSAGRINDIDMLVGFLAILLVLDATRRATGWGLTLLATIFLVYGFYAKLSFYPQLNESIILATGRQVMSHLVFITEGLLGTAIGVSASYIILFILFGAFLGKSGLGQLFNDLALAVAGHTRGGPAKVAVLASGFLGSINGSAIANVVTTGAFTIPLMKRTGYKPNFAGAVEASASVGGQILPPIMGAAAFIMAEVLSVPYTQVVLAGIIPALLFYLGVLFQVHLRALRNGLEGIPRSELTPLKAVMLKRGHLLVPMVVLLWLLFDGRAPFFAAFWSIAATVLICGTRRVTIGLSAILALLIFEPQLRAVFADYAQPNMPLSRWSLFLVIAVPVAINALRAKLGLVAEKMDIAECRDAMHDGVRNAIPVAIACGAVGIIVGIATLTGIALEAADAVVALGQQIQFPMIQLLVTLFLTMIASIVLGMGLPSIPTYIITSTMAAPILLNLPLFRELAGSNETAIFVAHMFVFYFGLFANLTPPVALAAYAGAGISGGSPNATGFQAMKLAIAGFVVPYMFVFAHSMLMIDATLGNILWVVVTGVVGVLLLAVAVEGYLRRPLNPFWRLLAATGALTLIYPGLISDIVGAAIAVVLFLLSKQTKPAVA